MQSLPRWLSSYANTRLARPFVYAAIFAILIFAGDWTIHTLTNTRFEFVREPKRT